VPLPTVPTPQSENRVKSLLQVTGTI